MKYPLRRPTRADTIKPTRISTIPTAKSLLVKIPVQPPTSKMLGLEKMSP